MHNILLIEDDPEIVVLLNLHFDTNFYQLTSTNNGKDAYEQISKNEFDLIILDVNLPDSNGFEICKIVRKNNLQTPIMMLTSRFDERDKVLALRLGADDYVTKPFSMMEFMARVKALLRRSDLLNNRNEKIKEIVCINLHIDEDKRKATLNGNRLEFTSKEFDLLLLLARNPGKTFTRRELLEIVWGSAFKGYEHIITAHINRLRNKLEEDIGTPQYIITTWGSGYRFKD